MITTGRSKEKGTRFWMFITLAAGWDVLWILGLTDEVRMTLVCLTCRKKFMVKDKNRTAFKSHIMNHKDVPEIGVSL